MNIYKNKTAVLYIVLIFFIFSCSQKRIEDRGIEQCLNGYVLMIYLGEQDKPVYPVLIHVDKADSSYLQYYGKSQEKLEKNGFILPNDYIEHSKISVIPPSAYNVLKSYIIEHNTFQDDNIWTQNDNTIKIILKDECDSVKFVINKAESLFITNLIDSLKAFDSPKLKNNLEYIKSMQLY